MLACQVTGGPCANLCRGQGCLRSPRESFTANEPRCVRQSQERGAGGLSPIPGRGAEPETPPPHVSSPEGICGPVSASAQGRRAGPRKGPGSEGTRPHRAGEETGRASAAAPSGR